MKKGGVWMKTISERLLFLLDVMDMKQTELAEQIGISKQSLYQYLHGKCEPRAEIIAKMARVLHTSADFVVGLTEDSEPISRTEESECVACAENEFLQKYRKLSPEDRARIDERMNTLLEK